MANRSYLYLKNDKSTRILCEGIYQIPLFWQCLWGEKELVEPNKNWKLVYELAVEENEEAVEQFVSSAQLDILVSLSDYRSYAQANRPFVEQVFPDQLSLYDQFLAYIEANVADGDLLGADVLETVEMGVPEEAEKELLGNQQAIKQCDKSLIGVNNLYGDSVFADFTGYTNYYADLLSETDRLLTDDDLLTEPIEPEVTADCVEVFSDQSLSKKISVPSAIEEPNSVEKINWKWFGLIVGLVVVLRYLLFS